MIFQYFDVDENLCEKTQHGTEDFPIAIYIHTPSSDLAENMPDRESKIVDRVISHWHNEFQFNYIISGSLCYFVEGEKYDLSPGEGLFINSGCLHNSAPLRDKDIVYAVINFHPRVIYGYSKTMNLKYVSSVQESPDLTAIKFDRSAKWHEDILTCLNDLCNLSASGEYTYELSVLSKLLEVWSVFFNNIKDLLHYEQNQLPPQVQKQLNTALHFIHTNYSESITLEDIADSLQMSRESCCRFFKRTINQSPIEYLNRVRIMKSASLLLNTDMSILEIASSVGFCSSSYYTDRFKKMINCTPKEYRNQNLASMKRSKG